MNISIITYRSPPVQSSEKGAQSAPADSKTITRDGSYSAPSVAASMSPMLGKGAPSGAENGKLSPVMSSYRRT